MKLYLIHCGFYDLEMSAGIYEFHINIPVAAMDLEQAKMSVRRDPSFIQKKMHIDGIQELKALSGFRIELVPDARTCEQIESHLHRDL